MQLPLYSIVPERQGGKDGYRVCLNFRDQLLPIPGRWYVNVEVANLVISRMSREDYDLWRRHSLNPRLEIEDDEAAASL